jgi:glucose-1-phosphate thymidylyltransferase
MSKKLIGLIPAAGKGTRLAPFPCPKELFPVGYQEYEMPSGVEQRPKVISQYLLENILLAGAKQIFIILGDGKQDVAKYYGDGSRFGCDIAYLYQERLIGMPGALDLAWPWIGGDPDVDILFGMPDTILEPRTAFQTLLAEHLKHEADLTIGMFKTDNPSKFGMVEFTPDGKVISTIDKPKHSLLTHMWGFACWSAPFTRLLHEYIRENQSSPREIVLGDVFNRALELKMNVRAVPFDEDGLYMDIGTARELDAALKKFHL